MKTKIISFLVLISVIFLTGCEPIGKKPVDTDRPIGGQRDEHGCLGPAGYMWSEEAGSCIRDWELNENQRKASKIAVGHVGYEYATTIIKVDVARCPGCFVVHLEKGTERNRFDVTLENWKVKADSSDAKECKKAGGTWLADYNECEYVGSEWCEKQGGKFFECESACRHDPEAQICTMQCVLVCKLPSGQTAINSFEDCVNAGNPVMESYPRQCRAGDKTFTEVIDTTD